jgi:pimeloyl-ACP methyl ester carboxylesterase
MADFEITPNSFAARTTTASSKPPTLIFFVCGNPGSVAYYHTFLSLLSVELSSRFSHGLSESGDFDMPVFNIYGTSLRGFEIDSFETGRGDSTNKEARGDPAHLYGLEQQIDFVQYKLNAFVYANWSNSITSNEKKWSKRPKVILVGHSVGSYISMEILRRHREKTFGSEFDIIGAVLLFPTIMDIAMSPAGRILTV